MLILALESSAKPASVAVCRDGALLGQYFQNSGLTHSRTLLAMAQSLLENLDIAIPDIDLFAVSRGPGSFTGVRIGVSAAKGLAWGVDKPACGVSTLEAMAYQAGKEPGALICPVMDARRGQVYNALFMSRDGAPARYCNDRAISLEELANDLRAPGGSCRAPGAPRPERLSPGSPALLIGDGAALTYDYLKAAGVPCEIANGLMRYQTAYGVALAAMDAQHIPAVELEPFYLRPSQAERELSVN